MLYFLALKQNLILKTCYKSLLLAFYSLKKERTIKKEQGAINIAMAAVMHINFTIELLKKQKKETNFFLIAFFCGDEDGDENCFYLNDANNLEREELVISKWIDDKRKVTRENVRQLESKAFARLKKRLLKAFKDDFSDINEMIGYFSS